MSNVKKPHTIAVRLTNDQLHSTAILAARLHITRSQAIRRMINHYFGHLPEVE